MPESPSSHPHTCVICGKRPEQFIAVWKGGHPWGLVCLGDCHTIFLTQRELGAR